MVLKAQKRQCATCAFQGVSRYWALIESESDLDSLAFSRTGKRKEYPKTFPNSPQSVLPPPLTGFEGKKTKIYEI